MQSNLTLSTSMEDFKQMATRLISEMLPPTTSSATTQNKTQANGLQSNQMQLSDDDIRDPEIIKLLQQLNKAPNPQTGLQIKQRMIGTMRKNRQNAIKGLQTQVSQLR